MTSKLKTDVLETVSGSGTIALTNQFSGMTTASVPTLAHAQMASGSVLQVVGFNSTTSFNTTSSTYQVTHLTQSITPIYANSKIIIQIFAGIHVNGVADHGRGQIRKDGATITGYTEEDLLGYLATTISRGGWVGSFAFTTAGSTNAATYAYYAKSGANADLLLYRNSGILITEIKQ